jgi:hypothetical protein
MDGEAYFALDTEWRLWRTLRSLYGRDSMAKGLYRMSDGHVLVEYGNRRRVPARYKANGYKPAV